MDQRCSQCRAHTARVRSIPKHIDCTRLSQIKYPKRKVCASCLETFKAEWNALIAQVNLIQEDTVASQTHTKFTLFASSTTSYTLSRFDVGLRSVSTTTERTSNYLRA